MSGKDLTRQGRQGHLGSTWDAMSRQGVCDGGSLGAVLHIDKGTGCDIENGHRVLRRERYIMVIGIAEGVCGSLRVLLCYIGW